MKILLTGAAGFIGFHAASRLLDAGHTIVGVDNLNDYYTPRLKQARTKILEQYPNFESHQLDLSEKHALDQKIGERGFTHILHLAAQAGVRHSIKNPHSYIQSNVVGHLNVLEYARQNSSIEHVVYASSSSIYGDRDADTGFKETDLTRNPASLYAATKLSGELISESYANLYGIRQTGLRFFSVYGPMGRPDMAYWLFTEKILAGEPITLFAPDIMLRDFTYITDIVEILPSLLDKRPKSHKIYNLGNSSPNTLMDLVRAIETACGKDAKTIIQPQQAGDVRSTFADISEAQRDFGFAPKTHLNEGISIFVNWYRHWQS